METPCKYCGQVYLSDKETKAERMEDAISQCNCPQSWHHVKRGQKISAAELELINVFEYNPFNGAHDNSADSDTVSEIRKAMESFIPLIVDLDVRSLVVGIPQIGKITISTTSSGAIKVSKKASAGIERKVE
jgi:hypothetical protein